MYRPAHSHSNVRHAVADECQGPNSIVRTLAGVTIANPGSEYGEGILDGLIVDIDPRSRTVQTQLVTG